MGNKEIFTKLFDFVIGTRGFNYNNDFIHQVYYNGGDEMSLNLYGNKGNYYKTIQQVLTNKDFINQLSMKSGIGVLFIIQHIGNYLYENNFDTLLKDFNINL